MFGLQSSINTGQKCVLYVGKFLTFNVYIIIEFAIQNLSLKDRKKNDKQRENNLDRNVQRERKNITQIRAFI